MTKIYVPFSLSPLDGKFVGPKPIEEAPHSTFYELEEKGELIIERKRNGHCSYTTFSGPKKGIEIYSSGINELTAKLPAIVDELRALNVPRNTMIAGELFVDVNGCDDLGTFGSIARSNPDRAVALQEEKRVQLAAFNIIAHKGHSVIHYPYKDRLDMLRELFAKGSSQSVGVVDVLAMKFDEAREQVLRNKWEGLVLYSKDAGSMFSVDGIKERPPRPVGCWKWKPYSEGDFVATGWVPSTSNRFMGQVKDLLISQYDPITNELVHWGKVGVGLSAAQRKEFMDNSLYPMVFEVKFERRTPNNRLISAHILRRRFDKQPSECYSPKVR
jgi:ATP-dependent DNA ligase